MIIDMPLPDRAARQRVVSDLDANLLVEAGAGSGKTTALVRRMVALVRTGLATVDEIAAVTFTRKAAAELRERFQAEIESELRAARASAKAGSAEDAPLDPLEVERLASALSEIDRAFVGTIHSFCARLLRERPLEVGLDPGFEELPVEERAGLRRRFWDAYLERLARDSDPLLEELARAGLRPALLFGLFDRLVENPDVHFPVDGLEPPSVSEVQPVREALEEIVDRGWELMDDVPPERGWDSFQRRIRKLQFEREVTGWTERADLFEAMATLCKPASSKGHTTTFNRWRDKEMTRAVMGSANEFGHGDTPAQRIVDRWYAYRYGLAIRLGQAASEAFAEHRRRIGKLDFQDLLLLAARLLRTNPDVRRQLGRRYRRLLVDEFQDTDPLQAEIMLLLSSEPEERAEGAEEAGATASEMAPVGEADWRSAVPRPGALFVVGDPKQSIYRFRRADIQLYALVRDRFDAFGEVVSLSANFRSRPPIGDLVNQVFGAPDFFPDEATLQQAAFERLDTRPPTDPVVAEGIFTYHLDPKGNRKDLAAVDDGARIASWIRRRVDAGERAPADFLVLTRGRGQLAAYARALEAYGLPVQVTGAGIGVEDEIHELQVVLACMIDPTDPVKVLSALVGLLFGLDYEQLVEHRLAGGSFDVMTPGEGGQSDVLVALRRLHGWWRESVTRPADIFITGLAHDLGLLPLAASGDLGSIRAGAVLYALDSVRAAALAGDASLPGALGALTAALELTEAEAPLEPGRPDALRLMNLHQAKGLEGTVVILADPTDRRVFRPDVHLARGDDGRAEGFLRVTEVSTGPRPSDDLARPLGWADREEEEARFEAAEEVRLLYVAVTRAREELVVARWPEGRGTSPWAPLDDWLDSHATLLEWDIDEPLAREELELTPESVRAERQSAAEALEAGSRPSHRHVTVTEVAKGHTVRSSGVPPVGPPEAGAALRGYSWGSAVHGALAVATAAVSAEALRAACRNLLIENQRPLDDHGEPVEIAELLTLLEAVRSSSLWSRAMKAERFMAEVPFSVPDVEPEATEEPPRRPEKSAEPPKRQLDLFGEEIVSAEEVETDTRPVVAAPAATPELPSAHARMVLEGVIDLAFRESDGWVIADYKTDVGTDPHFASREEAYRRQVDIYARAWQRLTGEPVKERVLFFTSQGRIERW
ncbi:MAG: UvrD-helicase domain-containing protein [Gemmatimonadetes bacterium]|nr:UvrD-helicase domain-containing protein [Gemmatimonadota bacterium]NNF12982.1 UvrD-helicase domain-containing protein [Gemmatimonadota bacterium]NNL29690.1 UvrD-helicase domain-containing protein [Gemmatimonadota bacterium]